MLRKHAPWVLVASLGLLAFTIIGMANGEPVDARWIILAAICTFAIAYRYYARFIGWRVLGITPGRATPAISRQDGLDYVPTNRVVLFGHHFAAIAGAGPLVGPVLAAQMGYLPGLLWLLVGVVLAGAVQDLVVLFISMRRDGRSLGELVRMELGPVAGGLAMVGAFLIMIVILAVLSLIVVKALAESPWGFSTVALTIPLAVLMGLYGRFVRPGRIGEMSLIGIVGLLLAVVAGERIAGSPDLARALTLSGEQLSWLLMGYGAVAALLPVWLLLAPRDYLSTFLKIGAIAALAVGVAVLGPDMRMPAVTAFALSGDGPVWAGPLFPFLFITIACGAVSGFHALIASGTTPKLIDNERHAPFIGYGAMLMESFVAVMALIAACLLDPGIYFSINSPAAVLGGSPQSAAAAVTAMGYPVTADQLTQTARDVGELSVVSRTGGAPTLAIGMAHVFSQVLGGKAAMPFWYHFAILFEALFILTAIDAGTRAGRFMLQDALSAAFPRWSTTSATSALVATVGCVGAWGFLLYQGVTDPLGGVNTLWPLFGISNQMLAAIALMLGSAVLLRLRGPIYALVTAVPATWLLICTLSAGALKIFSPDPKLGFLAHARKFDTALRSGELLAPAKSPEAMRQVIWNDLVDAALCAVFMALVIAMLSCALRSASAALRARRLGIAGTVEEAI